jgi:rhomboid protease GluP
MKPFVTKLKYILPTYFVVTLSTVLGFLFIRWLFSIQFEIIDVKEEVWELWLPIAFAWIPVLIWLRPKFRILTFKKDNDNGRFFCLLITAMAMMACLMISQNYLSTTTGRLERLTNITDIDKKEKVRYYKLLDFNVAQQYVGSHTDFRTSGKYNERLNFNVYFVTPIIPDSNWKFKGAPTYWYGVKYSKQISNRIKDEEKEAQYKDFYDECVSKMRNYNFHSLDHFERTPNSDDRKNFLKAIERRINQKTSEDFIVLEPISEPYENRNGHKLAWIFGSYGIGLVLLFIMLLWAGYDNSEHQKQIQGKKPKENVTLILLKWLIPEGSHFASSIILDLNILVFVIMVLSGVNLISPNGLELLEWGGNRRMETTSGEWWRLLTSMFIHGGIMHLILNIYGLFIATLFLEQSISRIKYLIIYIFSGVMGSLASIWWFENTVSVGASGAIFGLYGTILGLCLTDFYTKKQKKGIFKMIGIYVGLNLLYGLTGGIDNAAHIGGLLSGAILGILLYKLDRDKKKYANK